MMWKRKEVEAVEEPRISALMPTANRRNFVQQALYYFDRQTYPNKEMIIVDDGQDRVFDLVQARDDVKYLYVPTKTPVGIKRNYAAAVATGAYFCLWDDDDYFSPDRFDMQIVPLLLGSASVSVYKMSTVLDVNTFELLQVPDEQRPALPLDSIASNTAMFKADYWRTQGLRFGDLITEDADFMRDLLLHGATVEPLDDPLGYIYVRHGSNISDFAETKDWQRVAMDEYLSREDQAFYQALHDKQKLSTMAVNSHLVGQS